MTATRYLRPDVSVEPLAFGWPAHLYPLYPPAAALYLREVQLPSIVSFLETPDLRTAPPRDRIMMMACFMDHPEEANPQMRAFLEESRKKYAGTLQFAAAIDELRERLAKETGNALRGIYPEVPEALRGLVELCYPPEGGPPSFRFIEGATYQNRRTRHAAVQGLCLTPGVKERRESFFQPRLAREGRLLLDVPLESPALDALLASRWTATDPGPLADALSVPAAQRDDFFALFHDGGPERAAPRFEGKGMRARYFNHATVLLEGGGVTVLSDPWIPLGAEKTRFGYGDLPERIDYVVLSHGHQDHLVFESLLALRRRIGTIVVPRSSAAAIVDPSLKTLLRAAGFENVVEVDEFEELRVPGGGALTAIPFFGEHCDLAVRGKAGFLVRLGGAQALLAADTNNFEPSVFSEVVARHGKLDALFIGMECEGAPMSYLYGAFLPALPGPDVDASRRADGTDSARALQLVETLGVRRAFIYAMGDEPWLGYLTFSRYGPDSPQTIESAKFLAECKARGVEAQRLFGPSEHLLGEKG